MVFGNGHETTSCRIHNITKHDFTGVQEYSRVLPGIRSIMEANRWVLNKDLPGLWLTFDVEDNLLPGFHFKVPMMIVLETLKNDDPGLRRISETWMRCSLKSYLRCVSWECAL